MTTQQPYSRGANAGIHEAKSNGTETAALGGFFVPGKGGGLLNFNLAIEDIRKKVKKTGVGTMFMPKDLYKWAGTRWLKSNDNMCSDKFHCMDDKCQYEFRTVVIPFWDALNEQLILEHSLILRFHKGIIITDRPGQFEVKIVSIGGLSRIGDVTTH
jgi:hypothetical protein